MSDPGRQAHWQGVYTSKGEKEVSWYQDNPAPSLELIALAGASRGTSIVDIGGGASRLVDHLLAPEFQRLTVLDLSAAALDAAKARLGENAKGPLGSCRHHQMESARSLRYLARPRGVPFPDRCGRSSRLCRACEAGGQAPGGHVIIGTFALDGPEKCSGLPIVRHDAASLSAILGPDSS